MAVSKKGALLCVIILSWNFLSHAMEAAEACHVEVFEVGQGNCTLVACGRHLILIDCGSKAFKYADKKLDVNKLQVIIKRIDELGISANELIIIVSHPEQDHYKWFARIFEELKGKRIKIREIILGCDESLYVEQDFKDQLAFLKEAHCVMTFLTRDGNTTVVETRARDDLFRCEILPALQRKAKEGVNQGCLVVKVTYGRLACLLMADADKNTVRHILGCPDFQVHGRHDFFADVKLSIVSHHGSGDNCDDDSLLSHAIDPCFVISSGIHGKYRHPHKRVINRLLKRLKERHVEKKGFHPLYWGVSKKDPAGSLPCDAACLKASFDNGYELGVVNVPIYGTLGQGTMRFKWSAGDEQIVAPHVVWADRRTGGNERIDWLTEKDCLLASLLQNPYSCVSISNLTMLDLSRLDLDDSDQRGEGKKVTELLQKLDKNSVLKELVLCENNLQRRETLVLLKNLFLKHGERLERLYAQDNQFDPNQISSIFENGLANHHPVLISGRAIPGARARVQLAPVRAIAGIPPRAQRIIPAVTYAPDALHDAIRRIDVELIETLLGLKQAGMFRPQDTGGLSPLQLAVFLNQKKIIEQLIKSGESVDEQNASGSTLLHIAALCGNLEAAMILVGVDQGFKTVKNVFGQTPYDIAIENEHLKLALLLNT